MKRQGENEKRKQEGNSQPQEQEQNCRKAGDALKNGGTEECAEETKTGGPAAATEKKEPRKDKSFKDKLAEAEAVIEELNGKLAKEKDDYIRLMAEFETFRRRSAEERLNLIDSAATDTIKGLLPVLDDCERAMDMLKDSQDEAVKEGTTLIYNKLMAYLKTRGLETIEARGLKFDTDLHEAVAQLPVQEMEKKGLVYDVVETGYRLHGKIIRYAKVVVGI